MIGLDCRRRFHNTAGTRRCFLNGTWRSLREKCLQCQIKLITLQAGTIHDTVVFLTNEFPAFWKVVNILFQEVFGNGCFFAIDDVRFLRWLNLGENGR